MKQIRGKRALVTGAASGIGRGIALALAREGADVYLWDLNTQGLAAVAEEIRTLGVQATTATVDLTRSEAISSGVRSLINEWGTIDILVNNAGVAYYGPTHKMTAAQWDWLMGINLLAPIQITRELLPILLERPEAHLLNVCSISGLVAGGRFAAYHTSKFGLIGFTESIRAEYGRRGLALPGPGSDESVSEMCHRPARKGSTRTASMAVRHHRPGRIPSDQGHSPEPTNARRWTDGPSAAEREMAGPRPARFPQSLPKEKAGC